MKKKLKKFLFITTVFLAVLVSAGLILFVPRNYDIPNVPTIQTGSYRVITYNLKYSSSDYDAWYERRDDIVNLIEDYKPDSIGMQEADWNWMQYIPTELQNYSYVGVGRDDGVDSGEYAPIFYLTEKFEVLENGTFWLSETPVEPSYGWDAANKRICTYAILKNNLTDEIFAHFNTHLDHVGKEARAKGAELILSRIDLMEYPVVLTGDMNFFEGSSVYDTFENSDLGDSKHLAEITMSWGTMNYFTNIHIQFIPPIDFIFVSEAFDVNRYAVLYQHRSNGVPLSDHYPVMADISLLIVD